MKILHILIIVLFCVFQANAQSSILVESDFVNGRIKFEKPVKKNNFKNQDSIRIAGRKHKLLEAKIDLRIKGKVELFEVKSKPTLC